MPNLIINLKTKTIKQIKIYSQENNINEGQVIRKALDQFFEEDYTKFWDDLYQEAINVVKQYDKGSASLLQRQLKIGYGRACRIMNQLEKDRIVESGKKFGPRKVLIKV